MKTGDGVEVARATNAVLTTANAQLGDRGNYHAIATNNLGSADSDIAVVTVSNRQCNMPNGTVANIGTSYTTRCVPQGPGDWCTVAQLGSVLITGRNTTHMCGANGQVQSTNNQCSVRVTPNNCRSFYENF